MSETTTTGTTSAMGTVTIYANQQIEVAYTRTLPTDAVSTTPTFEYDNTNLAVMPGSSFEPAEPSVIIQPSSGAIGTYTIGIYQGTLDESNLVLVVNPVPLEVDAWNLQQAPIISAYTPASSTTATQTASTETPTLAVAVVSGPSVTASVPSSAGTVSNVGTVIVSGTSPPHNQTTPGGATSTATGPSLNVS